MKNYDLKYKYDAIPNKKMSVHLCISQDSHGAIFADNWWFAAMTLRLKEDFKLR